MLQNLSITEAIKIIQCEYGGSQSPANERNALKAVFAWRALSCNSHRIHLLVIENRSDGQLYTTRVALDSALTWDWHYIKEKDALEMAYPNWSVGTQSECYSEYLRFKNTFDAATSPTATASSSGASDNGKSFIAKFNHVSQKNFNLNQPKSIGDIEFRKKLVSELAPLFIANNPSVPIEEAVGIFRRVINSIYAIATEHEVNLNHKSL